MIRNGMCCLSVKKIVNIHNLAEKTKRFSKTLKESRKKFSDFGYEIVKRKRIMNEPKIIKIDSPLLKSCITEEVLYLKELFTKNGHEIRIVGGAVRDLLMGIQPLDLDFATTATPSEMKQMFQENNCRMLNMNGERHGTITTRINEVNFEVTTLRIDVATNGRHALVEFTKDWLLDANRRDLTINAMYLGLDGTLYDYFNGYEDLKNKRIVFVGDAASRIKEDYLRILRYFRFFGRISETPDSHDEDVLKAIRDNAEGLLNISGERIRVELIKICEGKFVGEILIKMLSLGIGPHLGIPENADIEELKRVWDRLKMRDEKVKFMTILCSLFRTERELEDFYLRLKVSNVERELGSLILRTRNHPEDINNLKKCQSLIINATKSNADFLFEVLKYQGKFDVLEELKNWKVPVFPVNGNMLTSMGYKGKEVGIILKRLKNIWFDQDFNITAEELLQYVRKKPKH